MNDIELTFSVPVGLDIKMRHGVDGFHSWIALIERAKREIAISSLYLSSDAQSSSDEVIEALERSLARRVHVKIIFDSDIFEINGKKDPRHYKVPVDRLCNLINMEIKPTSYKSLTGGVMHSKYVVSDGEECWIGSNNFDWRSFTHIFETGVILKEKTLVQTVMDIFLMDWHQSSTKDEVKRPSRKPSDFKETSLLYCGETHHGRISGSPKGRLPEGVSSDLDLIRSLLAGAQDEIQIQLRKFSTSYRKGNEEIWIVLVSDIIKAARRGVHVKILVDDYDTDRHSNTKTFELFRDVQNVEWRFVKVPEANEGFIPFARLFHSKTLTVDNQKTWIGSANWAPDDLLVSRNVGLVVVGHTFAKHMRENFFSVWESDFAHRFQNYE